LQIYVIAPIVQKSEETLLALKAKKNQQHGHGGAMD
jgi:hypothetical protein